MPNQKKYQITFGRTEEIVVELGAENEAKARALAFDLVSGRSAVTVRAMPMASPPEAINHSATEWSIDKVVEIVMRC